MQECWRALEDAGCDFERLDTAKSASSSASKALQYLSQGGFTSNHVGILAPRLACF